MKSLKLGVEGIGRLEAEIMAVIWNLDGKVTVRQVYEIMRQNKSIAYTTIITVMNNLAAKKLLTQDRTASAFLYEPTNSSIDVAVSIVDNVVDKLLAGDRKALIQQLLYG